MKEMVEAGCAGKQPEWRWVLVGGTAQVDGGGAQGAIMEEVK